jgi:DNA-binding protein H-NS
MAKAAAMTFDEESVLEWFESLGFEEQDQLLQGANAIFSKGKLEKIEELESELARLKGEPLRKGPRKGGTVAPKYMNPVNSSETWAGRGVKPKWVKDYLDEGGKVEDLLIDKVK